MVHAKSTDEIRIEMPGAGAVSAHGHQWIAYREGYFEMLACLRDVAQHKTGLGFTSSAAMRAQDSLAKIGHLVEEPKL